MIARALVVLLLLVVLSSKTSAVDRKEWVKLTDCHYVDAPDNDGDSFRVRGGDKEFTARLYYVDAPETNLRQADWTISKAPRAKSILAHGQVPLAKSRMLRRSPDNLHNQ